MGRPAGSRNVPWDAIVQRCRLHAGRWIIPPELASVPERYIVTIRRKERRALRLVDGAIQVRVRAHSNDNGRVKVTLALRFKQKEVPHGTTPIQSASQ